MGESFWCGDALGGFEDMVWARDAGGGGEGGRRTAQRHVKHPPRPFRCVPAATQPLRADRLQAAAPSLRGVMAWRSAAHRRPFPLCSAGLAHHKMINEKYFKALDNTEMQNTNIELPIFSNKV